MAESGSGSSNSTIDSYIGSLISLTSKSEIRYEGILYTADEKDSTIALQSVRSFGTEGRKKDGPQIPPSEKVYEYIIFRASDIKDLFVKSPPSTQTSQIHSDPAIISLQSQYSQQSSAAPKSYGPSVSAPQPDPSSLSGNAGVQSANFRGASPLFPTPRNLGTWGSTPVPGNGAGLAVPMYWQGYYGPTSGLVPHMQQQPLHYHSPPGIPIPPGLQQNVQQNQVPSSIPMGLSPSEFNAFQNAATAQRTIEAANPTGPIPGPMTAPATTSSTLAASNPVSLQNHIQSNDLKTTLSATVPVVSSGQDSNFIGNPSATKSVNVSISASTIQSIPQTVAASVPSLGIAGQPNLVTPGQLLQTGTSSTARNKPLVNGTEESDRSKLQSKSSTQVASDSHSQRASNQPLLPLPTSSTQHRASHQVNGMVGHSGQHSGQYSGQYPGQYSGHHSGYHQRRRGRAIDRGGRHATSRFTEDFDFIAMNEKFNKDEVWGHLGKVESQDGIEDGEEDNSIEREGDETRQTSAAKPVYVKDDFFDSLSCEALDRSRNDRRFSEQRKLDSETFGSLSRSRGRGRGSGYRGNYRGSYYGGRGNGYGGRGRGGGRTYY